MTARTRTRPSCCAKPRSPCTGPSARAPTASRSSTPRCAPTRTGAWRSKTSCAAAIEKKQLKLVYQPIFYLPTETLAGFEALLRWEHPRLGLLNPTHFVPVAEESDLIIKLGSYVLTRAVREAQRWQRELPRPDQPLFVSVNVSSRQLFRPELINEVRHHPRPRRRPQGLAAAGDHRIARHGEPREGSGRAGAARGRRRGPVARRLRHRLLVALLSHAILLRHHQGRSRVRAGSRRRTAPAPWCCARSSRWRTNSARKSSRKASRPRTTSASCARSAASTRRASTTASRWRSAIVLQLLKVVRRAERQAETEHALPSARQDGRSRTRSCGRCRRHQRTAHRVRTHGPAAERLWRAASCGATACNRSSRPKPDRVNGLPRRRPDAARRTAAAAAHRSAAAAPACRRSQCRALEPAADALAAGASAADCNGQDGASATARCPTAQSPASPRFGRQPPPLPGGARPPAGRRATRPNLPPLPRAAQRTSAAGLLQTAAGHPGEPGRAGR